MRLGHTACKQGKRVRVLLQNGKLVIDKFKERKPPYIWLENYGKIHIGDIKTFGIYKTKNTP